MSQGQKNFINSYENMIQCYEEWGVSLLEDIKDLDKKTTHEDYKQLEDGIIDYIAMAKIIGASPSSSSSNYCQLASQLREKSKELKYQNKDVPNLVSKLYISKELRELFHKDY